MKCVENQGFAAITSEPAFLSSDLSVELKDHIQQMECLIKNLISEQVLENEHALIEWIEKKLPLIQWSDFIEHSNFFSVYVICESTSSNKDYIDSQIKKKFTFGKEVEVLSSRYLNFYFPYYKEKLFFIMEAKIYTGTKQYFSLWHTLPVFLKEVTTALKTPKKFYEFLDFYDHIPENKLNLINEILIHLIERRPQIFDKSVLREMNQFFILAHDEFKEHRAHIHLLRIIIYFFSIRKNIRNALISFGKKQHLRIRFIKSHLQFPFGSKSILGIVIGISLFDRRKILEEKHLLWAIQKVLPHVQVVKGSFYLNYDSIDEIRTLYLEIEKQDGTKFTNLEVQCLKKILPIEIQNGIEQLVPSLFMKRNEEEIIKSILYLNRELTSVNDLPQMMVHLETQTKIELIFIVVLVRIVKDLNDQTDNYFQRLDSTLSFTLERNQVIGYLENKPKEANVLRIKVPYHADFLRSDFSINFYLARQKIVNFMTNGLGQIRDYNGGMILKQNELLLDFKQQFLIVDHKLIEDFFYSLCPIERQATTHLETLVFLFQMYLEIAKEPFSKNEHFILKTAEQYLENFVVIKFEDMAIKKTLDDAFRIADIDCKQLTSTYTEYQGTIIVGYIYKKSKNLQNYFEGILHRGIQSAIHEIQNRQILRLAIQNAPTSLDPRIGGDEHSRLFVKLLFEGLLRIEHDGSISLAIAEAVEISENKKCYSFKLRRSFWSNGDLLIAYDFEYAWKKILSLDFKTQFSALFFPIKHAKNAKQGLISIDQVGIKAIDQSTLVIELEHPTPYFLELLCLPPFSAVNHRMDQIHPNWPFQEGADFICNGPFQLKKQNPYYGYELIKNTHYWDGKNVALEQIIFIKADPKLAYEMFKNDELDFVGRILPAWEPELAKKTQEKIESQVVAKISWCVFNTQHFFFNNVKIRQAFAMAINKKCLAEFLDIDEHPSFTPLPFLISQNTEENAFDWDPMKARSFLEEGLDMLKLTIQQLPTLNFAFPRGIIKGKMVKFIKDSWEKVLGIKCALKLYDWPTLFSNINNGDCPISLIVWTSWINDPIYTLNSFRFQNDEINFSKWVNADYQTLLNVADLENDKVKRLGFLKEAEKILINHMPVCPLFSEKFYYLKKEHVIINDFLKNGHPDFKRALISKKTSFSFKVKK